MEELTHKVKEFYTIVFATRDFLVFVFSHVSQINGSDAIFIGSLTEGEN